MNFCKRSYQPILRYRYTEVKKRRGEISLHKYDSSQSHRGPRALAARLKTKKQSALIRWALIYVALYNKVHS